MRGQVRSDKPGKLTRPTLQAAAVVATLLEPAISHATPGPQYLSGGVLEEIIVTARRREESSVAVPISLTRIDGATIDSLQYRSLDQFVALSPGVLVYSGGDRVSQQITIRGVVTPGQLVEPGNAVYVDDIYVSGMHTLMPGFYDIESVQVLKGPQAGLYGRNTTGGAVIITTGQPTAERTAHIDASYAQYDTVDTSATLNLPLSDALRLRATGWYRDTDGGYYISKVADTNLDAGHQSGGRLTLALLPNESAQLTITGEYIDGADDRLMFGDGVIQGAELGPPPLPPENRRNVLRDDVGGLEFEVERVYGKFWQDTDLGKFELVAGWQRLSVSLPWSDFDGSAYSPANDNILSALSTLAPDIFMLHDRDTSRQTELRFLPTDTGKVRMSFGVSYYEESLRVRDAIFPVREFAAILNAADLASRFAHLADQETRSWAGFGELIWTPVEAVELTASLRYTRDRKAIDTVQTATGFFKLRDFPDLELNTANWYEKWSPGITLAYRPRDEMTIYGKYTEGFRAGGFNTLAYDPELLSYESEESQNYEVGSKQLLFDRRAELGVSLFYLRIDNALLPRQDPGEVDLYPLQNGGVGETAGIEVDLTAAVATGLTLSGSAGAYHYEFGGSALPGYHRRSFAPDFTASVTAHYEREITSTLASIVDIGFRHRQGGILPDGGDLDSYHLLDLQVGVRRQSAVLAAFVRNALDNHYVVSSFAPLPIQGGYLPEPGSGDAPPRTIWRDPGSVYGVRVTLEL